VHECVSCKQSLPSARFNKNQLRNKGPGKQRCQDCVAAGEAKDASESAASQLAKLDDLRREAGRVCSRSSACHWTQAHGDWQGQGWTQRLARSIEARGKVVTRTPELGTRVGFPNFS
jgi:hypothetical protein